MIFELIPANRYLSAGNNQSQERQKASNSSTSGSTTTSTTTGVVPSLSKPVLQAAADSGIAGPGSSNPGKKSSSSSNAGPGASSSNSSSRAGTRPPGKTMQFRDSGNPGIKVDISGAQLDANAGYSVSVRRHRNSELSDQLHGITGLLQQAGGLLITAFTLAKLWEEVRFLRLVRKDPNGVSGGLAGMGAANAGQGRGGGGSSSAAGNTALAGSEAASAKAAAAAADLQLSPLCSGAAATVEAVPTQPRGGFLFPP